MGDARRGCLQLNLGVPRPLFTFEIAGPGPGTISGRRSEAILNGCSCVVQIDPRVCVLHTTSPGTAQASLCAPEDSTRSLSPLHVFRVAYHSPCNVRTSSRRSSNVFHLDLTRPSKTLPPATQKGCKIKGRKQSNNSTRRNLRIRTTNSLTSFPARI